jgi:RNA polymerase sigma-70 factor (ECF subfamily)
VAVEGDSVSQSTERLRFESLVLPHLDAAFNLARWLTRNDHDAEDVVQEAYFRALKFFHGYRGGDAKAWLLQVVRRACFNYLNKRKSRDLFESLDEQIHGEASTVDNPEKALLRCADRQLVRQALEELPLHFREALVLRELEGLSYQQIAGITDVPIGTVMSRLARARDQLHDRLAQHHDEEA